MDFHDVSYSSNMFALKLQEELDDEGVLCNVTFVFKVNGFNYGLINPYFSAGDEISWDELLDAIRNPRPYRTSVKICGGIGDCDYVISIDNGYAIFSTDYDCSGEYPATDIMIPASACIVAFTRARELVVAMDQDIF